MKAVEEHTKGILEAFTNMTEYLQFEINLASTSSSLLDTGKRDANQIMLNSVLAAEVSFLTELNRRAER